MDWSASPLGSRETWPQSLKLSVAMILASGFPMAVRWGPEQILIYNDAYRLAGDGVAVPVVRHLAAQLLEPLLTPANCGSFPATV